MNTLSDSTGSAILAALGSGLPMLLLQFLLVLVLLVAVIAVSGPVLTSDGPSHVSMAHFMTKIGDPAWPLLAVTKADAM